MNRVLPVFQIRPQDVTLFLALFSASVLIVWTAGCPAGSPLFSRGGIWVSEVFADPNFTSDSEAEFIELCRDSGTVGSDTTITLSVDGKVKAIPTAGFQPGTAYTICRDSVAGKSWGIPCRDEWTQLSLANDRLLWTQIRFDSIGEPFFEAVIPESQPGIAKENVAPPGYAADFRNSGIPFRTGFASPGECFRPDSTSSSGDSESGQAIRGQFTGGELPDISTLKLPRISRTRLSITEPEKTLVGFPTAFVRGEWRLATSGGQPVVSGKSPEKAGWMGMDLLLQDNGPLPCGPLLLVLEKGSKRWIHALVVIP